MADRGRDINLAEMQTPNLSSDRVQTIYSAWAKNYEREITDSDVDYHGPFTTAAEMAVLLGDQKQARIIDLAAGTGLVARDLRNKYGFQNIDAVDACENMLAMAKANKRYDNIFVAMLGPDKLPIESNTYDAATMAGGWMPGHADGTCLEEIIRIIKPGGYFVTVAKEAHLFSQDKGLSALEGVMQEHEKKGLWRLVARKVQPYYDELMGVYFIYQIL